MKRKYPYLSSPLRVAGLSFRNRMFSAPMGGTDITADCCIGRGSTAFYELRARGGAAAVTVSELMVHPETDASHAFHLNLQTPGSLSGFAYTADAIRRHGAVPSVELSHSGQYAGSYLVDKDKKRSLVQYGPSEGTRPDGLPVTALSEAQLADIVRAYGNAAALAKRAGFEMVMVHGGHGWLVNQFLSPYFNLRTDAYGGSFKNRTRLALEILASVREAVGKNFPIEFRMSGAELFDGGYSLGDGVEIAKLVENYVDILHVSAGSYQFGFATTHPSMFAEHGCNVYLAEEIKKHVRIPVATIGALNEPEAMEEILATGKADVVEMARALLADPALPDKVLQNQDESIVKCLRCFTCMAERVSTQTRRCAVNPVIGRELDGMDIVPALHRRKVVVAGGGCGGMKAALTAAARGHSVVLYEKSNELGGILKSESALPFKKEMYELGLSLAQQVQAAGVTVHLNTELTAALAEQENADALIVAVGSEPIVPPLPGIDSAQVIIVNNYYLEKDKVTDQVVVLGGGLAGCECALHLAMEGKKVHLVEMRTELAVDANVRHRPILLEKIAELVTAHTGFQGIRVSPQGLLCRNPQGTEEMVPGTSIICAVGQRSCNADHLLNSAPQVRLIGDCVRPATITTAMYQGYHAALHL